MYLINKSIKTINMVIVIVPRINMIKAILVEGGMRISNQVIFFFFLTLFLSFL